MFFVPRENRFSFRKIYKHFTTHFNDNKQIREQIKLIISKYNNNNFKIQKEKYGKFRMFFVPRKNRSSFRKIYKHFTIHFNDNKQIKKQIKLIISKYNNNNFKIQKEKCGKFRMFFVPRENRSSFRKIYKHFTLQ